MVQFKEGRKYGSGDKCVFISYSHVDRKSAIAVAEAIHNAGVAVYLDAMDKRLGMAVSSNDDGAIVERIEEGVQQSTHLIGVISNATKGSWWVPFEIGAVRTIRGGDSISALILDEVDDLPSFIKVATVLETAPELTQWLADIDRYHSKRILSEKRAFEERIPGFGQRRSSVSYR